MLLQNLTLFLRIIEKGGLGVAGREMGLSPTTVSERLAALESYYGATLLNRTTRAISLTDEGQMLVDGARRLLSEANDLETRIRLGVTRISGPIRMSTTIDLGRARIAPLIDTFLAEHPEVSVDVIFTDGYVDLVGQGIDLAIRYGVLADSSLKAKKLAESRRIVCAAPSYLKAHGTPAHPKDLQHHNCLLMRFDKNVDREWQFAVKGKAVAIAVNGDRIANDGALVREWCIAGHGLARKSTQDIETDLRSGALVEVLPDFQAAKTPLHIVYPASQAMPRRVRLFIDHVESAFRGG